MRHRNYFLIRIFLLVFLLNLGPASALVYSQNYDNVTVKAAQENLQKLGYDPGPADGIWGRKTENALRKYQSDNELSMTGKLDAPTLKSLGEGIKNIMVSIGSIQKRIKDALDFNWEIRKVEIKNQVLTVTPNFNNIHKKGYASMMPWIYMELCKYPHVVSQLEEVRILNINQNQGWVHVEPQNCRQIIRSPFNRVEEIVLGKSHEFDPYENRRK